MLLFADRKTVVTRRGLHVQGLGLGKGGFALLRGERAVQPGRVATALQIGKGGGIDLFLFAAGQGKGGRADNRDGNPFRTFGHDNQLSARRRLVVQALI